MPGCSFAFSLLALLAPLAAQKSIVEPVTDARLQAAYVDARAACEKVLAAKLDELPPLQIVGEDEVARVVAAENLPAIRLREPDPDKAKARAEELGRQLASAVYAKYAWSTRTFLVAAETWERTARILKRPELTADQALRAVLVHELCHALDDRRFDFAARIVAAKTVNAAVALNAVIEGHAQLATRRVCAQSGWSAGFAAYTSSIGALPEAGFAGEAATLLMRATAAAMATAYHDGERFAAAVVEARPATGAKDMFESPPQDPETILQPQWYLDPKMRPELLYDVEPAIDAFVAKFDPAVWSSTRFNATGQQLATGLTMLPKADIDSFLTTLRAVRLVQLAPTAKPQSKTAILCAMEFDSEDAARRWVEISGIVSAHKDETMTKGALRIKSSKTTPIDRPGLAGLMQEKEMRSGWVGFEVVSIDAYKGRMVLETIYSGEPPDAEEHVQFVEDLMAAIVRRK